MIFVGDIASPNEATTKELLQFLKENRNLFENQILVSNLEGLLAKRDPKADKKPLLSNDPNLPAAMKELTKPVFGLANNHVLDLPGEFRATSELLKKEGIPFAGAGLSSEEAEKALSFMEGEKEVILFNACWDFLLYSQKNPSGDVHVAETDEEKLLQEVLRLKMDHPDAVIAVYLHWSLDLESLPFPMYRQFSRALIDAGAGLVVGTHAHCVQGGESYKDAYILYGLGNFFLPDNAYAGGRLKFPSFAKLELALEWNADSNRLSCHWFEYRPEADRHSLAYLGSDDFESSERLRAHSPYREMNDREYISYYKKHRRKKILIPVYRDYRKRTLNSLYTRILKMRARTAHTLAKMNFIKWQN